MKASGRDGGPVLDKAIGSLSIVGSLGGVVSIRATLAVIAQRMEHRMTDYGSTVGLSPINEDGAGIYRQAFITAGCVLHSSRKWRDAIENAIAKQSVGEAAQKLWLDEENALLVGRKRVDQLDLNAAVDELRYTVLHLDAALTPYVVDGKIIDKLDERNLEKLAKLDLDDRTDLARQLADVRGGVFERLGFSGLSAHKVVYELGEATLRAVEALHQRKDRGGDIDCLLGSKSVLRTEIQGLGRISRADFKSLEKACLWEAEQAWARGDGKTDTQWSEAKEPKEWCDHFDKSLTTLNRWIDDGLLKVDKITTRLWRISVDTLKKMSPK